MFHYLKSSFFNHWRSIPGKIVCRMAAALAVALGISGCVTQNTYNLTHFSTVVVDAGHGGHDSGTTSRGGRRSVRVVEKDVGETRQTVAAIDQRRRDRDQRGNQRGRPVERLAALAPLQR